MMFRVKRSNLISEIWELSKVGSVVLTGQPGVGKSWMIAQLIRRCRSENRPHLPIAAEDFDIKSVDELAPALNFKTDIFSVLRGLGGEPLLLIDGLDALRAEPSQHAFRELIRRVSKEVGQCSIVASIRTFDLQQSEQLQQLFFSQWPGRSAAKQFTQVVVHPFSDEDLQDVIRQVPGLGILAEQGEPELRQLLRVPFNLHLAASLLDSGVTPQDLSVLQSQIQLLDKYWRLRVEERRDSSERRQFLRRILREMVNHNSLSVAESVSDTAPADLVWGLESDEILRKGVTGRLSFSHNILFDFASARVLLDEENVVAFIRDDSSRTIFFRPTLSYFFRRLWVYDRDTFWRMTFSFVGANDLPERATIVPAIVIQEAATRAEDVEALLASSSSARNKTIAGMLRAVQTVGELQGGRRQLWLGILGRLSEQPDLEFINEYIALLSIGSETASPGEARSIGKMAQRLLRWIWATALRLERERAVSLSDIGVARLFPIVAKFGLTNVDDLRNIVREILQRLTLPSAGSHEMFWLAHEINRIVDADPELGVEVYQRTFGHAEVSDEKTSMGGGIVLQMTSTRRQDFSTALYGLQAGFHHFLDAAPIQASIAAVRSVEAEVARERPIERAEEKRIRFRFADRDATYVSDNSEIWDSGSKEKNAVNLLDGALRIMSEKLKANKNDSTANAMVTAVVDNAKHAVVWKHLLEMAGLNIREMYHSVAPLLAVPAFIAAPEVTVAVGNVLTSAYSAELVSDADRDVIESAIAQVPAAELILRYEKPESIRNRLLRCIPEGELRSLDLKNLSASLASEAVRKNEPFFRTSFWSGQYTEEDWLREQGVDTETPEHSKVLEALKPLREFEHKYLNEVPSSGEAQRAEGLLRVLRTALEGTHLPDALDSQVVGTMCAVSESVLKNEELSFDSSVVQLCKQIVVEGARHPSPKYDPEYHDKFDMPAWGGASPRIEAAQGLGHFIWNWGLDPDVIFSFVNLSVDQVPAVRYQVATFLPALYKHRALDHFWTLVTGMLSHETTSGVELALFGSLGRIAGQEPQRVIEVISSVLDKGLPSTERHELSHELLAIVAGLYIAQGQPKANEVLLRFEGDPITFHREVTEEVLVATVYIAPPGGGDPDIRNRARAIWKRILLTVYQHLNRIIESTPSDARTKGFRDLLSIQDEVATRVYFALESKQTDAVENTSYERQGLYFELKPILELLTTRTEVPGPHHLAPHTAHYLMQTMNSVLRFDPPAVVGYSAAICKAASSMSYQFDSLAVAEMVKLVGKVLADYKDILRDRDVANALGTILDIFVRAGWPQALQLTFSLDRAVR
jgi:hypothetical protein